MRRKIELTLMVIGVAVLVPFILYMTGSPTEANTPTVTTDTLFSVSSTRGVIMNYTYSSADTGTKADTVTFTKTVSRVYVVPYGAATDTLQISFSQSPFLPHFAEELLGTAGRVEYNFTGSPIKRMILKAKKSPAVKYTVRAY